MTAPTITNTFGSEHQQLDTNFNDIRNYLAFRNSGSVSWDDIVTKGPWVDVRAYETINAAITDIASATKVLLIPNAQTLAANLTVPSNVTLWFLHGGSIVKASTYTLTINGPVIAVNDVQIFSGFATGNVSGLQTAYFDWFGSDSTAFQNALSSLVVGGRCMLGAKNYGLAAAVSITVNRISLEGVNPGSSTLSYNAPANDTTLISIAADLDNVVLKNLTLNCSNPDVRTGTAACRVIAGTTKVTFDRVYCTGFNGKGLDFDAGTYYLIVKECRFLNTKDATSTNRPTAVYSAGSNVVDIHDCYFSGNDQDINILGGTSVQVYSNNFEGGGSSGNSMIDWMCRFNEVNNLWFANNYIEGNDTNGGGFLLLDDCKTPLVENNLFQGQSGATTVTDTFIKTSGACRFPVIRHNTFIEVLTYFVNNVVPCKLYDNYYEDGATEKTTYATITPYIADLTKLDLDIMGDYAATSTIVGWTTPTAKIWFEKMDDIVHVSFEITGTSNATTVTFTLPFANAADWAVHATGLGHDNGLDLLTPTYITLATSSSTVNVFTTFSAGAWTNINAKKVYGQFFYKAA